MDWKSKPATTERIMEMAERGLITVTTPEEAVAAMAQGIADTIDAEIADGISKELDQWVGQAATSKS